MCGIAGIIQKKGNGVPFLVNALNTLNTRGYDGYGIKMEGRSVVKAGLKGLNDLIKEVSKRHIEGVVGIAHNRWATHGAATVQNAHPHVSGSISVVHNGTIDNYEETKEELQDKGYKGIESDTDTVVFAMLVSSHRNKGDDFFTAVKKSLLRLGETSTWAFLVMDEQNPGQIIAARKGSSPILWATKNDSTYISSQESALNGFVQKYQELYEGDVALFEAGKLVIRENITSEIQEHFKTYEIDPEHYVQPEQTSDYWMYQEMMDAPNVIKKAIGKRARVEEGIVLGGIEDPIIKSRLRAIKKFFIAGCGTSYHAGQVIADSLQEIAEVEAEAIVASEAIYKNHIFDHNTTALIVMSQSGETADVIRLMNEWKPKGVLMIGIVNVPNTNITKLTDAGIYCHIGSEIAVASTKAFIGQVVCGVMFAIAMGQQRNLSLVKRNTYISELLLLPDKANEVLAQESQIKSLARKYSNSRNFLFMGRKYNSIVASEGALKLKEITWDYSGGIHALGISAGEMKHGTLAMIDKSFPTFVIAPKDSVFGATINNVSEIMAREGEVILVTTKGTVVNNIDPNNIIYIPETLEFLSPVLTVIPTQIFAFYVAIKRGCNPDMPRNLAKAVTVE